MKAPTIKHPAWLVAALCLAGAVHAQTAARSPTGQLIHPARSQGAQQADKDRFECHGWARQESGFDPFQAVQQTAAAQPAPSDDPAASRAGMARGAAGGAAIAELADKSAGKGAAVGVIGASVRQRVRQQQSVSAQQQQAAHQQAARTQQRGVYERGFAACMEARGYVVR
jgi:hypothetical protein